MALADLIYMIIPAALRVATLSNLSLSRLRVSSVEATLSPRR
jgi:hypothetical protein